LTIAGFDVCVEAGCAAMTFTPASATIAAAMARRIVVRRIVDTSTAGGKAVTTTS
jgi:hypothetical protein